MIYLMKTIIYLKRLVIVLVHPLLQNFFQNNPDKKKQTNNNIRLTTYGAPFRSMSNKSDDSYTNLRNISDPI